MWDFSKKCIRCVKDKINFFLNIGLKCLKHVVWIPYGCYQTPIQRVSKQRKKPFFKHFSDFSNTCHTGVLQVSDTDTCCIFQHISRRCLTSVGPWHMPYFPTHVTLVSYKCCTLIHVTHGDTPSPRLKSEKNWKKPDTNIEILSKV